MSTHKLFLSLSTAVLAMSILAVPAHAQGSGIVINSVDLQGVSYDPISGTLTAASGTVSGTVVGRPFITDILNFILHLDITGGGCSVLDLQIGPIDLDLLGLHVDTTAICLNVTAFAGQGILGDLLCALAGGNLLLVPDLLDALRDILNNALSQQTGGAGHHDICDGACIVLDLVLGPVDLTLLGVNVHLDNCAGGPVQVCISASEGEGLLGDLLCGLAGDGILFDLGNLIALLNALTGIDGLGDIHLTPQQITSLVRMIERALRDGNLSNAELNQIVRSIRRLIR